jgi:hypothetical protein
MGYHHYGYSLPVQINKSIHNLLSLVRRKITGRFIGNDKIRTIGEGPGNGHTLLLTTGHHGRIVVKALAQTYLLQQLFSPLLSFIHGNMGVAHGEHDIFQGIQFGKKIKALKYKTKVLIPYAGLFLIGKIVNLISFQLVNSPDGLSRRPTIFIRVDFPEPDGPMTATKSPRLIFRDIPSRAFTWNSPRS